MPSDPPGDQRPPNPAIDALTRTAHPHAHGNASAASSSSSSLLPVPSDGLPSYTASSPYPFAAAPDIIRGHQKDAYFRGHLANTLTDLHRRLFGARSAHAWALESSTFASVLYLSLTTLVGSRTLGEEYTDVVQVVAHGGGQESGKLPGLRRRAAYIAGSIVTPYLLGKVLPSWRATIRKWIDDRLQVLAERDRRSKTAGLSADSDRGVAREGGSREARFWSYVSMHLSSTTSLTGIHALTLAVFYFSGTYYELAKRLLGLRYVFTRRVPDTPDRAGYEVLGALLVIQMAVQTWMHVREHFLPSSVSSPSTLFSSSSGERTPPHSAAIDVSLSDNAYASNNELLLPSGGDHRTGTSDKAAIDLEQLTHTPTIRQPRFHLARPEVMRFIKGKQQRKCTLCLEELKDPAATSCGHVFCWECITDWVREKPECPLCRREALVQHVLPLRVAA